MPNRRRSAEEIRGAIVRSAVRVAGQRGVDGLTHRAVAEAAEVSLSSTTYHFASRDDIVAAALRWLAEQERAKAHAAVEALPARVRQSGLTHDDLLNLITEELVPEDRTALRAQYELQLYAADHPHLQAEVQTWIDAIEAMFGEVLERLEVPRPAETARLLVAVIDGLRLTALTTPATEAGAVRNRAALSWLLENLLPRPPHDSA